MRGIRADRRASNAAADGGGRASATGTMLAMASAGLLILLALVVFVALPGRPDQGARAAQARQSAELLARSLAGRVEAEREAPAALAGSAPLQRALREGDRETLSALAGIYQTAFPQSLRLLIVPGARLAPAPRAQPPIGYALVEQVGAAVSEGADSIEVHLPGRAEAHVNLVAAIGSGERLGALVLSYPLEPLRQALIPPDGAALRLEQRTPTGVSDILSVGNATGPTAVVAVAGTPWSLEYRAGAGAAASAEPTLIEIGVAVGAGGLLLLGAGWLLGRRLQQALRADADTFRRLVRDLAGGTLDMRYGARTRELEPGLTAALDDARTMPPRAAPAPAEPTAAAGAKPQKATNTESGSASDMEVTEVDAAEFDAAAAHTAAQPPQRTTPARRRVDPSIFRAYDIRGVVDRTLTAEAVRAIGQAIGSEAAARGQQEVVVGYDGRHSSPGLAAALAEGLVAAGRGVIELGRAPTPVVYFAAHLLETAAGVVVTGSHNPPEYNGLKIVVGGQTLSGDAIQALRRRIEQGDLVSGQGGTRRRVVLPDYLDRIAGDVTLHRPLKVVLDCGNGVAGAVAPQLFRSLGCEVEELFCEVDGDFPNHHPDPTIPENLDALIRRVRETNADVGLAFDGDGDRLGVVDNGGRIIWADRLMMLFARDILDRNPGSDIIYDVKCTSLLADLISENAGVPVMWKTGHSLIKDKLRETGAPLAGEMSGHIFFQERWYGLDDGLYAGARLLEILSMDPRDSAEVFAELPEGVSTPEIRVDLAEGEAQRLIDSLLADTSDLPEARITTIDGLRLDLPDSWGLVRASNTQPSLVLRFEGNDEAALASVQALFRERLEKVKPGIVLPF